MLVSIPGVLSADDAAAMRRAIREGHWIDGNATSGFQARLAKDNLQLASDDPAGIQARQTILEALKASPLFQAAALPCTISPPLFNRYGEGQSFSDHIDNAIRAAGGGRRMRTDLSATLFLSDPDDYDGGDLTIEDTYGAHAVRLAAGDLILYPSSSVHHVSPVTRGERISAFLWVQSLVRSDAQRTLLFDMDVAIQTLGGKVGQQDRSLVSLTGAYHNLLRLWAEL